MTDIQAKYQKLAAEFAKVRSQVPVLKKAVLDEQAKEEELKDQLKTKDQSIRKYEQEIDSLRFRNQQLSTRVEVLQKELEENNTKSKKGKKNAAAVVSNASSVSNSVIGEELQNKITENAKLHSKLFECEQRHQQEVCELKKQLEELDKEAGRHQNVLDESVRRYMQQVDKLQDDKILLEVKIQKKEALRKESEEKAASLDEKLRSVQETLSAELKKAKNVLEHKLPFQDCVDFELNSLNLPRYNRQHEVHCKELVTQVSVLIQDFVQGLSNWFTYTEQRALSYPIDSHKEPISQLSKKFCQHLHENASSLRCVDQSFKQFVQSIQKESFTTLETCAGMQEFSTSLNRAVSYVSKLLPYQLLNLDEENSSALCSNSLQARNTEVKVACTCLEAGLAKINTLVSTLASYSSCRGRLPHSSQPVLLSHLSQAVTDIHSIFTELAKHYRAKTSLEHELPTFSEKLKVTNECIMSALLSLVNVTGKMSKFFSSNLQFMCENHHSSKPRSELSFRIIHPHTSTYRNKAAKYLASLDRPCPASVPHSTAVHNRKTLYSSTESRDSLAQQVVSLQEKLSVAEQNREHWMLESKLLQMKYEKECHKRQELDKKLSRENRPGDSRHTTPGTNSAPGTNTAPGSPPVTTTTLGRLHRGVSEEDDPESRENFIKQYYTDKISQLTKQIQLADSTAVHFQAECRALFKRLGITQLDKDKLEKDRNASNQTISQLNDELQTTKRSYEGQLSMMSEHLASMNEKLTTQKDEIDILKYQLQNNQTKPQSKRGFLGK